jgi:hypothetical protein
MAEWFFRKKSKGEVERDPVWDEYFTSSRSTDESLVRKAAVQAFVRGKGLTDLANQWKDGEE